MPRRLPRLPPMMAEFDDDERDAVLAANRAFYRAFNDRDYGFWTGHHKSEVLDEWGTVDAAPGVEPTESVLARVLPALDDLAEHATNSTPLIVVTHDAVIRPVMKRLDPAIALTVPTGSYQRLSYSQGQWQIDLVDQRPQI